MLLVDLAFARKRCARHFGLAELGWVGMTLAALQGLFCCSAFCFTLGSFAPSPFKPLSFWC
jgi:hypothetical protein